MKKLSAMVLLFLPLALFSQGGNKLYEKTNDKFSVNSVTVLERTFAVGDTITLTTGSGPNGEFLSAIYLT